MNQRKTLLLAENLAVKKGETVPGMGAGCGILGIIVAEKAAKVVAVDMNPHAVRCAKENAKLNEVANKMFFVQEDLFIRLCWDFRRMAYELTLLRGVLCRFLGQ